MEYPKTVVIAITAHGVIPLYKKELGDEYVPHVFYLPSGRNLSVTKISSVVPGICNITNFDDVDKNMKYLIKTLKTFDISTATNDMKKEFLDGAQQYFQELDKHQIREIQSDLNKKQKKLLGKEQNTFAVDETKELIEIIELTEDIESDKQKKRAEPDYNKEHSTE